jgi:hypothetical protein
LTAIQVDPSNGSFSSLDGVLFDKAKSLLIQWPGGKSGSYTIPNTVTSIGDSAFSFCGGLTGVSIPNSVTSIGNYAFQRCDGLTGVTIPNSVISIGANVFAGCNELASVFFAGNAPAGGRDYVFDGDPNAIIYYLPGTTGWASTFGGVPAVLWNPQIQTGDSSFGGGPNGFSFNITGTPNIPLAVEASSSLTPGDWVLLKTLTLTNGLVAFSDPAWTNFPNRFYRLRSP